MLYSRVAGDHRTRLRNYRCENCELNFRTRESVETQALDTGVVVRRGGRAGADAAAGDGYAKAAWDAYRRDAIATQLRGKLVKVLSQSQRDDVLTRVEQRLEQRLGDWGSPVPAPVARKHGWPVSAVYIDSSRIRDTVEDVLARSGKELDDREDRLRHQSAHALWALATTGSGWTVGEVASWMSDNYRLPKAPKGSSVPASKQAYWYPPAVDIPTIPIVVVKNFRPVRLIAPVDEVAPRASGNDGMVEAIADQAQGRRPTEEFSKDKLMGKVRNVLAGRPHAQQVSEGITQWVLWSLVGQRVVRSSQISALVVDCLRRTDQIGYLRWVTVGKELSLEQLHQEALDLLRYPITQLRFRRDAAPALRPAILPGDSFGDESTGWEL